MHRWEPIDNGHRELIHGAAQSWDQYERHAARERRPLGERPRAKSQLRPMAETPLGASRLPRRLGFQSPMRPARRNTIARAVPRCAPKAMRIPIFAGRTPFLANFGCPATGYRSGRNASSSETGPYTLGHAGNACSVASCTLRDRRKSAGV